jgi:hypothetical protein
MLCHIAAVSEFPSTPMNPEFPGTDFFVSIVVPQCGGTSDYVNAAFYYSRRSEKLLILAREMIYLARNRPKIVLFKRKK